MIGRSALLTVTSVVMLATGITATNAQDIQFVSTSLASMQSRIDDLEERLAKSEMEEVGYDDPVCCAYGSGLDGGGGVAFLTAGHSDGGAGGYSFRASPRVWLGYNTTDDWGARARWFQYSNSSATAGFITDLDLTTVDVEITDSFQLGCKWEGRISGGLRYAKYRERLLNIPFIVFEYDSAYGPVLGAELKRHVSDSLSFLALARGSVVFDDELFAEDVGFSITEIQLGGEYRRPFGNCASFFVRAAAEAQYWSGVSGLDNESVTLVGGNLAIGVSR